jgi:glucose/arabinose dehydrogenase
MKAAWLAAVVTLCTVACSGDHSVRAEEPATASAAPSANASEGGSAASSTLKGNANCPGEEVFFDPGHGEDIVVPDGFKVEVFARDLNFPTGIAFAGDRKHFQVLVVESGTGLPSRCNDNNGPGYAPKTSATNPFTPDLLVFDQNGKLVAGPLFKPTTPGTGYQPDGPAIGIAFERGFDGGLLFVTDSNQGVRGAPGTGNNSSRVMVADLGANKLQPFITGLPTGDHPTEMIVAHEGFVYWSQGSATNSGVVGHDNGGPAGANQHEIACQDITLSQNTWDSGDGHITSGYSPHGVSRPGAHVPAFEDATQPGMCTGAILRAPIAAAHPEKNVQPFSWGYRNPFGLRFSPKNHALNGALFVTENGEDERGARPTNGSPDRLQVARPNKDGTPDYHGWPDRFGFLDSGNAVFTPIGGPSDDNPAAVVGKPVLHVLAFPPQAPKAPLALDPSDVAVVEPDFAPDAFVGGVVRRGAALVAREGDFGFSPAQSSPIVGHDVELVNFSKPGKPLQVELSRFAFNCPAAQQTHINGAAACNVKKDTDTAMAFAQKLRGINRPVMAGFGPDGALYLVDFGAVRDVGRSDPAARFNVAADGPLVQIPGTGVVWKISRVGAAAPADDDDDGDDD